MDFAVSFESLDRGLLPPLMQQESMAWYCDWNAVIVNAKISEVKDKRRMQMINQICIADVKLLCC